MEYLDNATWVQDLDNTFTSSDDYSDNDDSPTIYQNSKGKRISLFQIPQNLLGGPNPPSHQERRSVLQNF